MKNGKSISSRERKITDSHRTLLQDNFEGVEEDSPISKTPKKSRVSVLEKQLRWDSKNNQALLMVFLSIVTILNIGSYFYSSRINLSIEQKIEDLQKEIKKEKSHQKEIENKTETRIIKIEEFLGIDEF